LAAGQGERSRPITLKAETYLRSKAAVHFLGRRMIDWMLDTLSRQGISDYVMVVRGKENRFQIKRLVEYGEAKGVRVRYSRGRDDPTNTGSADATLTNLDYFDLSGPALVFPSDSLVEFDLRAMLEHHRRMGAVLTILSSQVTLNAAQEKYGVIVPTPDGLVRAFVEKPTREQVADTLGLPARAAHGHTPVYINAGFYLLECGALRRIARQADLKKIRQRRLDFGKDFLPWLLSRGYPVAHFPAFRLGDLGTVADYLETMRSVLRGEFPTATALLGKPYQVEERVWIAPETLSMRSTKRGRSVGAMLKEGDIQVGPYVRLGRYVLIEAGVRLEECNVDDETDIGAGATVIRSCLGEGTILGPKARVSDSLTGLMVEIRSNQAHPAYVEDKCALGDETVVECGARVRGNVALHPRLCVPSGATLTGPCVIRNRDDLLQRLPAATQPGA